MFAKFKKLILHNKGIPEPPYEYNFLLNLPESEYPQYLKKIFKTVTGDDLNLKNPKTFNEKIQWLKLYDTTSLKSRLTDKVLVREWIKNKIGDEYLKPCLQVCSSFNDINFDNLPNAFIIKCNHGCKWQFKIKDKEKFLKNKNMYNSIKMIFSEWLEQTFFPWAGFEMQYKDIKPQLIIEPFLAGINDTPEEIEIYCFNGQPKFSQKITYSIPATSTVYDENLKETDFTFNRNYIKTHLDIDDNLKKAIKLSEKLAEGFKLVRIDWFNCKDKIYFNEMTFTPFSGFFDFADSEMNKKLGDMLDLKK